MNTMAEEGMLFARMYTEPGCTPTRSAVTTGQHPVRNGIYEIGFPIEYRGMADENVTLAEVMSEAGYATAFYGKAHLGDVEEGYLHNQGYDEALWTIYNQVFSLWIPQAEAGNPVLGLFPELLPENRYRLDHSFVQGGYVGYLEARKGEQAKEWCGTTKECYDEFDLEANLPVLVAAVGELHTPASEELLAARYRRRWVRDVSRSRGRGVDADAPGPGDSREHTGRGDGGQWPHGARSAARTGNGRGHLPGW